MLGGMNKSQWERDRHLRTKEPNAAGLPTMQQRIDLGYGVKGPADVPALRIGEQKIPDSLNVGTYGDRLDGNALSYRQEGRYQIRDARAVLSSHVRALVSLGIARATAVNAPDRLLVCDPTGVVHLSRTATPITVYYRMTDDSATMARFSLYQMPMFSAQSWYCYHSWRRFCMRSRNIATPSRGSVSSVRRSCFTARSHPRV